MKRVLSLVLVIAMVLSSFTFAFAAPKFDDIADTNYEEAIDTLFALGVITGYEDGTYRPERTVTRAEMAKLMVELLGYGDLVAGSTSNFADTQGHWADQWIALAAGRGIVIGTGDGNFMPDATVTYDQVLTMLVRGLGYTDDSNELKGMTWPTNFKVKAAELNITKNVNMSSNDADRGGVAQAMYNALDQQLVKVNSDGDIIGEYRIAREEGRDVQKPIRLVSRIANLEDTPIGFEHIDPEDKEYAGDKVDLSQYLFQTVEAYFNKNNDKEIVYVGDVENLTYTEEFEKFVDADKKILEVGDYEFNISGALVSYNNDEAAGKFDELDNDDLKNAKITVVLKENQTRVRNGAIAEGLIIEKASAYVQVEDVYEDGELVLDEIFLPVKSGKVDSANLIVKGAVTDLADIEEDDIVGAYAPLGDDPTVEAPDKLMLVVSRDTVEGRVTGESGEDYYIDRVKYEVNDDLNVVGEFEVNDEGTFFLDDNGRIIAFTGDSEGSKTYAVVYDLIEGEFKTTSASRVQIITAPKARLDTASGERITYEFDVEIKDGKLDGKAAGLFRKGDDVIEFKDDSKFFIKEEGSVTGGKLVSYTLNKDGKITKLETPAAKLEEVRTNSASFVLASNAVIFDKDGKVISKDRLGTKVSGWAVYQNNRIVALLATDIDEDVVEYYAYITKVDVDTDDNRDEIQRFTAYINGAKNERLFTDDEGLFKEDSYAKEDVYVLKLNDNGIVTKVDPIDDTKTEVVTGTAIDVVVKDGKFKIGKENFFFEPGATIIEKDGTDVNIRNLNAIRDKEVTVYAVGGNVKFIIFDKQ